ncbi:Mediator of RNA polymerase II transcription subunit 11 [Mycena chlorophos]|uniref:Mediator of RNA polymerase II transcription subunit 11 n=1 Tax=Mycena chlorophos TaxID=658473 RepID=A0A8H6TPJ8_MYCCL|nr:Mediator of RNA polymerase II transcription subunit 11 [Mycena chlorophos]
MASKPSEAEALEKDPIKSRRTSPAYSHSPHRPYISLLTLPQTDGPEDNLPQDDERSELFVLEANEYFERLNTIQSARIVPWPSAQITHSRIAPSVINTPAPNFTPLPLGVGLPASSSAQKQNRAAQTRAELLLQKQESEQGNAEEGGDVEMEATQPALGGLRAILRPPTAKSKAVNDADDIEDQGSGKGKEKEKRRRQKQRGATANPNECAFPSASSVLPRANLRVYSSNPICNKTIYLQMPHTSGPVAFSVVDYFPIGNSVGPDDVGIPKYYFQRYAPVDDGIIPNVSWSIMSA